MHGQVKGRGKGEFADERYSALKPAVWKWVGTSSMLVFYTGYVTTYGREFTDEQREVVYQTVLSLSDYDLNSDQSQVPRTVAEMEAYSDTEIGRASGRERVGRNGEISGVDGE